METSYTIRKRKDSNRWQAIIRQKENNTWKQVESKTFEKKIQATQWSNKRSVYWQGKITTDYDQMTIKELKVLYLNYQKSRVKESTFITIKYNIDNANWFDDRKPLEIKPHEVDEIISTACYSHINYMRIFFNYLNNHLKLRVDNFFKAKQPKKSTKTFVLNKNDLEKIISLIPNEIVKFICIFLFYTGVRISELAGLTNDCIKSDKIIVCKQRNYRIKKFTSLKSENGEREIPLNPILKSAIQRFKKLNNIININDKLIDVKYLNNFVNNNFKTYLKGTEYEGLTCHDFRHSFISNLVSNNVDINTVAKLAGDDVKTILDNYVHSTKRANELSVNAVNSL